MSDVSANPNLNLLDTPQDTVREPRVRLGIVLGLLRILAGRRGRAAVHWNGAGFAYTITVTRAAGTPVPLIDSDPAGERELEARGRLLSYLLDNNNG